MEANTLKKTIRTVIWLLAGVALLIAGILIIAGSESGLVWKSDWRREVSVKDGEPAHKSDECDFSIDRTGDYILNIGWEQDTLRGRADSVEDIGFITVCTLRDDKGRVLYAIHAASADERLTLKLCAGEYHLEYMYFTSKEKIEEYSGTNYIGTAPVEDDFDGLAGDGSWQMHYHLNTYWNRTFSFADVCALYAVLLGACLLLTFFYGVWNGYRSSRPRYDERQELEQGRGFRYAFFCMMLTAFTVVFMDSVGILADGASGIYYASCIFIALNVYVIYCLWHDCYVSLNEKKVTVLVILAVIAVINLFIGINSLPSQGFLGPDGRMNSCVLNLLCGVTGAVLFMAAALRMVLEKRSSYKDAEDDE